MELAFCIAVTQQRSAIIHQLMYLVSNDADGVVKRDDVLAVKHSMSSHLFVTAVNEGEICTNS